MNLIYRRGRLPVIVTVLVTMLTAAQTANAEPDKPAGGRDRSASIQDTPWVRCASGANPNYSEILHMDGGRGKNYPEHDMGSNRLFPGDVLLIDADDTDEVDIDWWTPADGSDLFSPNGISPAQAAPSGWPGAGLNKYGLVGWFTSGGWPPSLFGSTAWCVTVPSNVSNSFWTLAINDSDTWDNTGAWDVVVKHYW